MTKKARGDREDKIKQSEERKVNRENYLSEAEQKFKDENKESIDAYEKYMEDFEVRQALAIIRERVQEMKKDDDWK